MIKWSLFEKENKFEFKYIGTYTFHGQIHVGDLIVIASLGETYYVEQIAHTPILKNTEEFKEFEYMAGNLFIKKYEAQKQDDHTI